jgi:hypothetical protein
MRHVRHAGLALVAVAIFAACGSGSGGAGGSSTATEATSVSADGDVVAVGVAPAPPVPGGDVGSIGDAVEVAAGAPGDANVVACDLDRQTLQTAVETYELLNGALPTSQIELLDAQLLREASVRFDVDAQGAVVAAPGSPCP